MQQIVAVRLREITKVNDCNLVIIILAGDLTVVAVEVAFCIGGVKLIPDAQAYSKFGYRKYAVLPPPAAPIIRA